MAERKRLNHFLSDMLKLSCVKGFKHFATHMRGREEMVCSVVNEPSMPIIQSATNSPASSFGHHKRETFPMSHKQQRRLSGYGFINVGLPPASPSENEEVDESQTMFLIAGYSRYNRPYVWVRTNHERLVRLTSEEEKDYPLLLQTTSQWQEKDVKVWDVLTELVEVCTAPCPPNPFDVDLDYFHSLPLPERALASAAMISFLQRVISSGPHRYDRRICSDIGKISRIHFQAMLRMVQEEMIQPPSTSSSLPSKHHQPSPQRETASLTTATVPAKAHVVTGTTTGVPTYPVPSSTSLPQPHYQSSGTPRPTSTVAQYGSGVTSTPLYPTAGVPQHHQHMQQQAAAQHTSPSGRALPSHPTAVPPSQGASGGGAGVSGGQFYSRRMGGSYNY